MAKPKAIKTGNGADADSCGWHCPCEECAEDGYFHCRKTDSLYELSIARGDVDFCPGCGEPWRPALSSIPQLKHLEAEARRRKLAV